MNELLKRFTDEEMGLVGNALERLYTFQDRPLSEHKRGLMVEELSLSGLPAPAILAGIRKLETEDLRTIKLAVILATAQEFLSGRPGEIERVECDYCTGGAILMKDVNGYEFALGCVCTNGDEFRRVHRVPVWTREEVQHVNGRTLRVGFPEILKPSRLNPSGQ